MKNPKDGTCVKGIKSSNSRMRWRHLHLLKIFVAYFVASFLRLEKLSIKIDTVLDNESLFAQSD